MGTLIAELDNPTLVAGVAGAETATTTAAAGAAVVTTDENGRPLPCEDMLGLVRDAVATAKLSAENQAAVDALQTEGTER